MNIITLSAFILVVIDSVIAHWDSAYFRNSDDGFKERKKWMSEIPSDWKLSLIAIPGTHDSGADGGRTSDIVYTQTLNFDDQLRFGIRFFDVRTRHFRNSLPIHHGQVFLGKFFDHFLNSVTKFLKENPTETVLFRLKHEHTEEENNRSFRKTVDSYLDNYKNFFLKTNNRGITLGEARGKFIIFPDNDQLTDLGIRYGDSTIQDNFSLGTNWDLYQKWLDIKGFLNRSKDGGRGTFFINYLSGSGGSFPYFVASGHSDPGTSSSRLSTGRTTPGWKNSYPDFPRTSCFIGICTISFEGTNILARDRIKEINKNRQPRTVGIIMADFPGDDLIYTIIRNNYFIN